MVLKRCFNEEEKIGLTAQEIDLGEKYLRKHKTAGALKSAEALKVYELYMIGCNFSEIHAQFPQHALAQIILTSALQRWGSDRERMHSSLRDRVKAKVVKSVIEQTDFLTSMLSVASTEHIQQMRDYIMDPNAPKPSLRITSIKDYKEITETLAKLVQGATPSMKDNKNSALFDALSPKEPKKIEVQPKEQELDIDALLREEED